MVASQKPNGFSGVPLPRNGAFTYPDKAGEGVRPDPFAGEKPRLVIDARNMAEHADKLTEGHKALFKNYPTYKMVVYPAVRTAFFPDAINAATAKNATSAKLEGTENVIGAELGFPFPIPKNGAEVVWNSKLKFRGTAVRRFNDQAIVKPDASTTLATLR